MQHERDRQAGLKTAGFVTGYRGSPLGGLDLQFEKASKSLKAADVNFMPGLNEELAATAIHGAQQATIRGEGRVDGVFSIWYGKGPGVDRAGDALKHANLAGSHEHGGVLALMGDDHTAESSTTAHQSELAFVDAMVPILSPAGVQEILDYGLHGLALSRFSGTWVGLKCVKDTVESSASVDGSIDRVKIVLPDEFEMPPGGLNIRVRDDILEQEKRLHCHKMDAVLAYLRANKLDQTIFSGGTAPKIGIIAAGKSYLDVRLALDILGIGEQEAENLGLRLLKVAAPWPLDPVQMKAFANGLESVIVVEEKRSLIEGQLREMLFDSKAKPNIVGKKDEAGNMLFPSFGALEANDIAIAIGERLPGKGRSKVNSARLDGLKEARERESSLKEVATRSPYFCAGCPHSTSTRVPEGSRAYAGIGCHFMAQWMDRSTEGYTQMGGEGANWIGEAPFSRRGHVFQNLGDGTYNHSGVLALRWAVDTNTNITYKILFNDAVAMTGGQRHEGGLTVDMIARQVHAEGVRQIALVTDEPHKYSKNIAWPAGLTIHHRDDLDGIQRELSQVPGVTVMIYDQTCASEKRRRRKRGTFPDPDKRVFINELVCEACGDCSVQSNCVAVQPIETEFGRKRQIDQSSCNKDFSCVKGFCPSFVTVHGAKVKAAALDLPAINPDELKPLPQPPVPGIDGTYNIVVTGVGGTGVVTIGAILGMAAHLEGKGFGIIDMAGLAQKGGAVYSHVRLANRQEDIHAIRVAAGTGDLVIGCDLVVTGTKKVLASFNPGKTRVVVNTAEVMPGDFTSNADFTLPGARIRKTIADAAGTQEVFFINATTIASKFLGDAIGANMFMLGCAYQQGLVPLSVESIEKAIELNGQAVKMNLEAFAWGRRAAAEPDRMAELVDGVKARTVSRQKAGTLPEAIELRVAFLADYQDARYAQRYARILENVREAESRIEPESQALSEAVAYSLFKLMAYKDEYEVARLYTNGEFEKQVASAFEGERMRFEFHLSPPLLARKDKATGLPRKLRFGPWIFPVFKLLASLKFLRGTVFDAFGYTQERRTERQLVVEFEERIAEIVSRLTTDNLDVAVQLAGMPQKIRGYGHVKERNLKKAREEESRLIAQFRAPKQTAGKFSEDMPARLTQL
ncbi:MAG: indolepyruvate ferredoxin oxidoreductase family protein, partial [Nitratireductor sp.]|nr:indolepyruvate ferredoxin oxidoreductase family protein [Nitratireductor sp.]